MTTVALRERITVGGVDLATLAAVAMAPDIDDSPELRGEDASNTGLSGDRFLGKLYGGRSFGLLIWVFSQDASGGVTGSPREQARANVNALYKVLALRTQQIVTRLMPDGTTWSCVAECRSIARVGKSVGREVFPLLAKFRMADPLWYGPTTTGPGSQVTTTSPKDFTFTNPGSVAGHRVLMDFTGPITNPHVWNMTNDTWVNIAAVVASTKHLLVDAYAFTALNDGVDVAGSVTQDGGHTPFMLLEPGANSMRVTSSTPGGSVLLTHFPGYL